MTEPQIATTQVHRVYIKATSEAIWDAITDPDWTVRYGYGGRIDYDLRPGGKVVGYTTRSSKSTALPSLLAGDWESTGGGGGWAWILSDLKSLLETGSPLAG